MDILSKDLFEHPRVSLIPNLSCLHRTKLLNNILFELVNNILYKDLFDRLNFESKLFARDDG